MRRLTNVGRQQTVACRVNSETTERRPFVERVLRWIGIVGLFYGGLGVIQTVVLFALNGFTRAGWGFWRGQTWGSRFAMIQLLAIFCWIGLSALLIISSWSLVRLKSWGRKGLMVWAFASIAVGLVVCALNVLTYANYIASTTQPSAPSNWYVLWSYASSWLEHCAFPLIVLAVLFQREAHDALVPARAGGFEVVPLATRATAEQSGSIRGH
jgi:heme/copper-type cytochrome/quinol oxidase subunit 3